MPSVITVAIEKKGWTKKEFDNLTIKLVPSYAQVTENNIPLLDVLDVMANIKKIPDTLPNQVTITLAYLLRKLDDTQLKQLKMLSFNYPPSTRALLGMLLDKLSLLDYTDDLKSSTHQAQA